MTPRTLASLLSVGLAMGPLVGCSLYGLSAAWDGALDRQSTQGVATRRIFEVQGTVRLPAGIAGAPLAMMPELATGSTLLGVAMVAGVHRYPQALAPVSAADGTVRDAQLQFVDLETGAVVATTSTDARGRYSQRLVFDGTMRPFVVQTLLRNQAGKVVGFLAAPLGVDVREPSGRRAEVDVSAASTMLAFSATLLSEAYASFEPSKGFGGVQSARLASAVRAMPPAKTQAAATLLGQSKTLNSASSFAGLLSDTATASAVLTFEVKKLAMQAMATDSLAVEAPALNSALLGQLVTRMAAIKEPAAGASEGFLTTIAKQVDLEEAKQTSQTEAQVLPTALPPLPTPTPALGIDVRFE